MKLYYKLILIICFIMYTINTYSQIHIDTLSVEYYNNITMQNIVMEKYMITNDSEEDYLTWVSPDPIKGKTEQALMYEYFFSKKGDFCLFNIMTENILITAKKSIGSSFIKRIRPGESFSYIISKPERTVSFYEDRIVIINKAKVDCFLQGFIINDSYYFDAPIILLINTDEVFPNNTKW